MIRIASFAVELDILQALSQFVIPRLLLKIEGRDFQSSQLVTGFSSRSNYRVKKHPLSCAM
jgi:hypothetical protein